MSTPLLANLLRLLGGPRDNALLRFSLGSEYLKTGEAENAVEQLREAVKMDPNYSAAWKLLGKALTESGRLKEALGAYRQGIAVAQCKGDKQAAKEMGVFVRRVEKAMRASVPPSSDPV